MTALSPDPGVVVVATAPEPTPDGTLDDVEVDDDVLGSVVDDAVVLDVAESSSPQATAPRSTAAAAAAMPGANSLPPQITRGRLGAVMSCYDYHLLNGVDVGRDLNRIAHRGDSRYKPLLEHLARRHGRRRSTVRPRGGSWSCHHTFMPFDSASRRIS